jgi:hypothetical protein
MLSLDPSAEGQLARQILIDDLDLLTASWRIPHAEPHPMLMTEMMPIRFSRLMSTPGM